MANLFGLLGLPEADRTFVNTVGQQVVYDAVNKLYAEWSQDLAMASAVFVGGQTENFKFRYKMPGGGRMQRRGGKANSGTVRAGGSWDVALPLEDFGSALGMDDISLANMTVQELNTHVLTIQNQGTATYRFEMLKALFNNSARSFEDKFAGTLNLVPLANGDSTLYPPVIGSESEATDTHFLVSGYTTISDTNNPFITIRNELEEHFGTEADGSEVVVFINQAQTPDAENLADFVEVEDRHVRSGVNVDIPINLPMVPGKILGRVSGVWVVEWRWVPATYLLATHLEQAAPLMERVDPEYTGLPRGLHLATTNRDYPLQFTEYRFRFGLGVTNRLNGVVMQLKAPGSYDIPTSFA